MLRTSEILNRLNIDESIARFKQKQAEKYAEIPTSTADLRDWLKYHLRQRGLTIKSLAAQHGLAPSTLYCALSAPYPNGERILAEAIGFTPQQIWPHRYQQRTGLIDTAALAAPIPTTAEGRVHWIHYQLAMRRLSVMTLAKQHDLSASALHTVFVRSYPHAEQIIADALNMSREQLWPERMPLPLFERGGSHDNG